MAPGYSRIGTDPGGFAQRAVSLNGTRLGAETLNQLDQISRTRVPDGAYWYDSRCGAWGMEGGPCLGVIQPGLQMGGPLRSDASRGNTGVFINGRELHMMDVLALQQMVAVLPGRYWLDAYGNCGYEGGPALGNLYQLAQTAAMARGSGGGGGNGDNFWFSRFSAGNYDPNSGSGYVSVPGYGPVGFGPG
jgi:hypothetical protein